MKRVDDQKQKNKKCFDKMYLHPEDQFLSIFDIVMLIIIGYSCFTSAYYLTFHMTTSPALLYVEDITYICFGIDITLNFFRVFQDKEGVWIYDHEKIAKRYARSTLFFDVISTFPFYLLPEDTINLNFKLVRLFRLTRVVRIFDLQRFMTIGNYIARRQSRMARV